MRKGWASPLILFRPYGTESIPLSLTPDLRPGLHSCAASRLGSGLVAFAVSRLRDWDRRACSGVPTGQIVAGSRPGVSLSGFLPGLICVRGFLYSSTA
jgi:hypothetical protein